MLVCQLDPRACRHSVLFFFFLRSRRPPRSTLDRSSAASDVYKRQDYARRCLQAVQAYGLGDRVQFLGSLPAVALREELATCTAVALAAYQETAPVTIAEAMAAGCPVVATAVGGVPDLIEDGQTGLLSPAADVDALAVNLRRLLDDAALAQRLGLAVQAAAPARFHPVAVAAQTRATYNQVMRPGPPRAGAPCPAPPKGPRARRRDAPRARPRLPRRRRRARVPSAG